MAIATLTDATNRLGRPANPDESAAITARLTDAEAAITVMIPDLVTQATPAGWFRDAVIAVECDVAIRAAGLATRVGVVQPGSGAVMDNGDNRPGSVYLKNEEWRRLGVFMMNVWNPYPTSIEPVDPEAGLWHDWSSV